MSYILTHVIPLHAVDDYLSSELPVFFELRIRYLQACERMQEAMALSKSCLENSEAGKHLYFHQAYLTCLYKASLHEHLHKEVGDKTTRDGCEAFCLFFKLYSHVFFIDGTVIITIVIINKQNMTPY